MPILSCFLEFFGVLERCSARSKRHFLITGLIFCFLFLGGWGEVARRATSHQPTLPFCFFSFCFLWFLFWCGFWKIRVRWGPEGLTSPNPSLFFFFFSFFGGGRVLCCKQRNKGHLPSVLQGLGVVFPQTPFLKCYLFGLFFFLLFFLFFFVFFLFFSFLPLQSCISSLPLLLSLAFLLLTQSFFFCLLISCSLPLNYIIFKSLPQTSPFSISVSCVPVFCPYFLVIGSFCCLWKPFVRPS